MSVKQRLKKLYEEMLRDDDFEFVTEDDVIMFMESEWGKGGSRGYAQFYDDFFTPAGEYFDCVNRIDEYDIYDCDSEAARQSERDGMFKIIRDIRIPDEMEIYPLSGTIIDNEHNRELLTRLVDEYRELKKPRYATFIYRKSDGECVYESEYTEDEMFVKKRDAVAFAKVEVDRLCEAFGYKPEDFNVEIEGNHFLYV